MSHKRSHITKEERFLIEKLLQAGDSYRDIAQRLGRGPSTICEEVSRNGGRSRYAAQRAEYRAYLRQYRRSGSAWVYASPKAIRRFAASRRLESCLYHRGRTHRTQSTASIRWSAERIFVDDPRCIRVGHGHWEGDFIVSSRSSSVLLVLVDRTTKETVIRWLPHRHNTLVRETIAEALDGKELRSLTVDNNIAFVQHRELAERLRCPLYFARPFRSTRLGSGSTVYRDSVWGLRARGKWYD